MRIIVEILMGKTGHGVTLLIPMFDGVTATYLIVRCNEKKGCVGLKINTANVVSSEANLYFTYIYYIYTLIL